MIAKIKRLLSTRRAQSETPLQREQRKNVSLHFELAAANKRADEAERKADYWFYASEKAYSELATIKRQRSDNTRRGNITRKAKREAAARAEG